MQCGFGQESPGARLVAARKELEIILGRRVSQETLAGMLGISTKSVYNYEHEITTPPESMWYQLDYVMDYYRNAAKESPVTSVIRGRGRRAFVA